MLACTRKSMHVCMGACMFVRVCMRISKHGYMLVCLSIIKREWVLHLIFHRGSTSIDHPQQYCYCYCVYTSILRRCINITHTLCAMSNYKTNCIRQQCNKPKSCCSCSTLLSVLTYNMIVCLSKYAVLAQNGLYYRTVPYKNSSTASCARTVGPYRSSQASRVGSGRT